MSTFKFWLGDEIAHNTIFDRVSLLVYLIISYAFLVKDIYITD